MSEKHYSREFLDDLILRARDMRNHPTPAEVILWEKLRAKRLNGIKFRRQHIIPPYIVDFCCISHKLIIEIDGTAHDSTQAYDRAREDFLQQQGFQILRFTNEGVIENLDQVMQKIASFIISA